MEPPPPPPPSLPPYTSPISVKAAFVLGNVGLNCVMVAYCGEECIGVGGGGGGAEQHAH